MRRFIRQHYQEELNDKKGWKLAKPPVTNLPGFLVGIFEGEIYGLEQLVVDLNDAQFGWSTNIELRMWWDFILVRNIDKSKPTVSVYTIPRSNERTPRGDIYGFYSISDYDMEEIVKKWHDTQGVIATYIEGWIAGNSKNKR